MGRLFLFSLLLFTLAAPSFGCSGSCASDTDCVANPCVYCDTGFGVCSDCCEFTEEIVCPTASQGGPCFWNGGECRNENSTACGVGSSELPQKAGAASGWFVGGLAGLVFGASTLFSLYRRRRRLP